MKEIGTYLVIAGIGIFVLVSIGKIISFIFENPLSGFALIAVISGVILMLLGIAKEKKDSKKDEPFRGVKQ